MSIERRYPFPEWKKGKLEDLYLLEYLVNHYPNDPLIEKLRKKEKLNNKKNQHQYIKKYAYKVTKKQENGEEIVEYFDEVEDVTEYINASVSSVYFKTNSGKPIKGFYVDYGLNPNFPHHLTDSQSLSLYHLQRLTKKANESIDKYVPNKPNKPKKE